MDVVDRLAEVSGKVTTAVAAVDADSEASPVLAAVVREFETKASKASRAAAKGPQAARDAVVELEQAAVHGDVRRRSGRRQPKAGDGVENAAQGSVGAHSMRPSASDATNRGHRAHAIICSN